MYWLRYPKFMLMNFPAFCALHMTMTLHPLHKSWQPLALVILAPILVNFIAMMLFIDWSPLLVHVPKKWPEMMQICIKKCETNEPPLGGHRHLPSRLLRSQVCTPTQCIGPISVCVSKKWPEMMQIWIYKCDNERAPFSVKKKLRLPAFGEGKKLWICFLNSVFSWPSVSR